MRTKRRAWITALAGMVSQMFVARAPARAAASAKVVFQHDLPDLTLENWAVTAVEVSYLPGGASASHRHPGFTVVYVLEGEVRSKVGDQPEATYAGGQMFFEAPGQVHAVSGNASDSKPAKLLALNFARKGAQLTTPA